MLRNQTEIDVRYAETDQMGVVYHANYLIWFEIGRTKLIEELGFNYAELEKEEILSPVTDVQVKYRKPLTYGQKAVIQTWIEDYNGLKVTYGYEIRNERNEICVMGMTSHVCVRKETFRAISIKKNLPAWHDAYEKNKKPKN